MSKVNFVSEFIAIMRYARDYSLTLRERMLWIALFYAANDRAVYNEHTQEYDWPDGFFQVSNGELICTAASTSAQSKRCALPFSSAVFWTISPGSRTSVTRRTR